MTVAYGHTGAGLKEGLFALLARSNESEQEGRATCRRTKQPF